MKTKKNIILLLFLLLLLIIPYIFFKNHAYMDYLINHSWRLFSPEQNLSSSSDSIHYLIKLDSLKYRLNHLKIEEQFWQNRLKMAKDKSVDLIIDLIDNLIIIEMKGIILKKSDIIDYKISQSLYQIKNSDSLLSFLRSPFILQSVWATIPKEPIVIKQIPKNPSEVDNDPPMEIPIDSSKVHVILKFNRNFSLEISPIKKKKDRKWLILNQYDNWFDPPVPVKEILMLQKCILSLQKYWIKLQIDNHDVRVIYRALSNDAKLIIRFG